MDARVSQVHYRLSALKYRYGHKAKGCVPVRLWKRESWWVSVLCEAWMPVEEAKQFVFDQCHTSSNRREYAAHVSRKWNPCITLDDGCFYTLQVGETE